LFFKEAKMLLLPEKKPAHEVILSFLERLGGEYLAYAESNEIRPVTEVADVYFRTTHKINILLETLQEMVIPAREIPGVTGRLRNLAEKLQVLYSNLKVLFMSGYTANLIAHHGVLEEGVNFIRKPSIIWQLKNCLRTALKEI